ncbi:hypothetical protein C8R44DRAFT_593535, partial [Mycena epipterygia]
VAIVDDRDPLIKYVGTWNGAGSVVEFNSTTTWSSTEGSTATFTFFSQIYSTGTSILYYAGLTTSDDGFMKASIVVDGGTPILFTAPSNPPAITNNLIYNSNILPDGVHTLVVTSESTQTLWTDYFLVTP